MPIPGSEQAIVEVEKVRDYLLSLEHPDGGSKASWFNSLGYSQEEWNCLADDLKTIACDCLDFDTVRTQFGVKYIARGSVGRPEYLSGKVLAVWVIENDLPPRLVTAYPDRDG